MERDKVNRLRRDKYSKRSTERRLQDRMRRQASYAITRQQRSYARQLAERGGSGLSSPHRILSGAIAIESRSRSPQGVPSVCVPSSGERFDVTESSVPSGVMLSPVTIKSTARQLHKLPLEPWVLAPMFPCVYCGAARFPYEVPGFCCGEGQVYLAPRQMVYELIELVTGESADSMQFRRDVRSYNNHLAFTSIGIKSDEKYCWSNKGVYTLIVQGMVFHYINSIRENATVGSNLDLYFHETDGSVGRAARRGAHLDPKLVSRLIDVLSMNPYARFFKGLRSYEHLADYTIVLRLTPDLDQKTFNLPSVAQVGAIWSEAGGPDRALTRDIRVYVNEDSSHQVQYYYGCYDPLQYPLLFPRGEPGWHVGITRGKKHGRRAPNSVEDNVLSESSMMISPAFVESAEMLLQNEADVLEDNERRVGGLSLRQYYCYLFQSRAVDTSYLLHFGRLTQQYAIDMYIKIETQRLDYYRSDQRQQDLRTDTYQGIVDSMSVDGQNCGAAVGRRLVLPSSFIGGPRDMRKRYVNAMALVQKYGKPDIFLTMTCNPNWPEISTLLLTNERPEDRPDLLARVFKAKLEELKNDIVRKKLFGPVAAYVYVVEFQKRGLPHVHWLLILKSSHKIVVADMYDDIISAELPRQSSHPFLRTYVVKHMLHGPCGTLNPSNVCMNDGKCKNHYPKEFANFTHLGRNSYPMYKRRDNGDSVIVRKALMDNRWVVPYNPYLLAKYNCHINVEICSDVKLVKYLYKYIYKGHDRVAYNIVGSTGAQDYDEISHFQTGRWIAAPEAFWRVFGFALSEMHPPVIVLQVHLENQQVVRFGRQQSLSSLVSNSAMRKTMLTEFFKTNALDAHARSLNLLYKEFPRYYVWSNQTRTWSLRLRREVVGRLVTVNPCEGDRFYERLLLNNIPAPTSFQFLRTVNGQEYNTFRQAALQLGLLASDSYISECLEEASLHQMAYSLRRLFATILVFCSPNDPARLWNDFEAHLSYDFRRTSSLNDASIRRKTLESIDAILQSMGKDINEYALTPELVRLTEEEKFTNEYEREKSIVVSPADLESQNMLNTCQRAAFDAVILALNRTGGGAFFVDGPGGAGKTFLYRTLLAYVRSRGFIALSVATSGVAASLLPGGRTAHSRFKFPLDVDESSDCKISKQSSLARLIQASKLVVWDEATMANRRIIEALDKLFRDVCSSNIIFGGKVILFGGDFRQTLPIIVGGSRDDMVSASFVSSPLWSSITKLKLSINMRAREDPCFMDFLLAIGDGLYPFAVDDFVQLPSHLCIRFTTLKQSLEELISHVFPSIDLGFEDPFLIVRRAILTPKNDVVNNINEELINRFPGVPAQYMSFDETDDPNQQGDYEDYLNSVSVAGLPPHRLVLKLNCPVILLRNLDPGEGLCNGARLIVRHLGPRLIGAEIAIGDYKGRYVFIPRIPLQATNHLRCPIRFKRHQFPLRLCFAMTINKAQGQTLDYVGIYLHEHVFSHGQLYVALSRAKSFSHAKVLICPATGGSDNSLYSTRNVVYHEIFRLASVCSSE